MSLWMPMTTMLTLIFPLCIMNGCFMDTMNSSLCWLTLGAVISILLANNKYTGMKSMLIQNFMLLALILSFTVYSFISFYIWFEFSLIPMLAMLMLWGSNPERLSATFYFVFYTCSISIPYFIVVLLFNLNIYFYSSMSVSISTGGLMFMWLPFLIKLPLFGLHFWLPKAHVEASTSSSMLLAGLLLKLGSYGIARVTCFLLFSSFNFSMFILGMSLVSSLITIMQSDIKKLIAYSSVTHMTFIVMAVVLYSSMSLMTIVIGSVAHGWISMAMFFTMGSISTSMMTRMLLFHSIYMWMGLASGLVLVANASVPPNPSFFTELYLISLSASCSFLSVFPIVVMSLAVCYYNIYIYMVTSHMLSVTSIRLTFSLKDSTSVLLMLMWNFISILLVL